MSPLASQTLLRRPGYFQYLAAMLEPLAIEKYQRGTFSYVIGASETKLLLSAWSTTLEAAGRFDLREARDPVPLRNVTLTGSVSNSLACFIDPALPKYHNAERTYYDRLLSIAELPTKYVGVDGGSATSVLLPGPYGNILTALTVHDVAWLAISLVVGDGVPIHNEIGDASTDDARWAQKLCMPVSKNIMNRLWTGAASGSPDPAADSGVSYVILPSTWGAVADPNTYNFRDDFMGATLDTASTWTRAQSTAGNVEIVTDFAWCKTRGNGVWGDNGAFSQASISRAAGKIFLCDVYIDAAQTPTVGANLIVGFHDGAGQADSDFSHGLDFTYDTARRLYVFENGNSRGAVGPNPGYTPGGTYRVRITLNGAAAAIYEIQGLPEYPAVGGATWTDVTPGTTSSATTPLHAGLTVQSAWDHYVGDVKIY